MENQLQFLLKKYKKQIIALRKDRIFNSKHGHISMYASCDGQIKILNKVVLDLNKIIKQQ